MLKKNKKIVIKDIFIYQKVFRFPRRVSFTASFPKHDKKYHRNCPFFKTIEMSINHTELLVFIVFKFFHPWLASCCPQNPTIIVTECPDILRFRSRNDSELPRAICATFNHGKNASMLTVLLINFKKRNVGWCLNWVPCPIQAQASRSLILSKSILTNA